MKQFKVWYSEGRGPNEPDALHKTDPFVVNRERWHHEQGGLIALEEDGHVVVHGKKVSFRACWLSDINPDNIPDDCECIVQEMATERAGEGDILRIPVREIWNLPQTPIVGVLGYGATNLHGGLKDAPHDSNRKVLCWRVLTDLSMILMDAYAIDRSDVVGHILTHEIVNGEVVERKATYV